MFATSVRSTRLDIDYNRATILFSIISLNIVGLAIEEALRFDNDDGDGDGSGGGDDDDLKSNCCFMCVCARVRACVCARVCVRCTRERIRFPINFERNVLYFFRISKDNRNSCKTFSNSFPSRTDGESRALSAGKERNCDNDA